MWRSSTHLVGQVTLYQLDAASGKIRRSCSFVPLWRVGQDHFFHGFCVCRKIGSPPFSWLMIFHHFPIWWFPEIGVPLNHQYLISRHGIFHYKPTSFGYLHVWNLPCFPHFSMALNWTGPRTPSKDSETASASKSSSSGTASSKRQYVRLRSLDPWAI